MVKIIQGDDSDFLSVAELQEIYQLGYDGGLYNAKEEGYKQGYKIGYEEGIQESRKEGIIESTIEMIKLMLKNNAKYDFISKVSGMSISEIKKIERSM